MMPNTSRTAALLALAASLLLSACSPKYDWRDYRSPDAPFFAVFPGKPSTHARTIDLDGLKVTMTMTAAEVDGATFAVGSAQVPDAAKAQAAIKAMQVALLKNIGGTVKREKTASAARASGPAASRQASTEIEANGTRNGVPVLLVGRFIAHDRRIYQVIVLGRSQSIPRDAIDMFLSSFKLN
jgi:hypothetical protein